jgi:hypothetical protein
LQTLRDEILQTEQIRSDLLKWKLVLAGALGATGLGFAGARGSVTDADLILCAIPPVCLYVDLLSRHLSLRILVIGAFLRRYGAAYGAVELARYEQHVDGARDLSWRPLHLPLPRRVSAFDLEDWAVSWSTIVLSGAVLVYGFTGARGEFQLSFMASGGIGLGITLVAMYVYRGLFDATNKPG